jgi:glucose-6-phosphate-specific signal transduction histidine kinase
MTRFGHEIGQTLGVSEVLARIAETSAQATRALVARVTATLPDGTSIAETWPALAPVPDRFDVVVPVYHDAAVVAEISVARPDAHSTDLALLRHIAAVSSAALGNRRLLAELERLHETIVRQNAEIAASQRRLIEAADVERRQLAHFVAQHVEPHLTLLQSAVPALRGRASAQPDIVAAECVRLAAHATCMLDEMRTLSRGLLPPILLDYGLAAALRALVRRLDLALTLDVAPAIAEARFPPPVESTVYLSCQTFLNTASRAGSTASAALRIWRDDGHLAFSISQSAAAPWSDDPTALRDRITALGGELAASTDGRRSTLTVTLPLADAPGFRYADAALR